MNYIRGIDVSGYQGQINWKLVTQAGFSFTCVKVSEGLHLRDDRRSDNIYGAWAAGIKRIFVA